MKTRIASGAVLMVLALAFILTGGNLLGIVCAVLSMVAFRELEHKPAGFLKGLVYPD